jgi:hypothetical protein
MGVKACRQRAHVWPPGLVGPGTFEGMGLIAYFVDIGRSISRVSSARVSAPNGLMEGRHCGADVEGRSGSPWAPRTRSTVTA